MGRYKVSEHQINKAFESLIEKRKHFWIEKFSDDHAPFLGFQREEIQSEIQELFDITMSDSGFRNRLKGLVRQGKLKKLRLYERIVFYFLRPSLSDCICKAGIVPVTYKSLVR
jgi:hypothetical protein